MQKQSTPSLADSICDLRSRKIKKTFFTQINSLLDWDSISKVIASDYKKGQRYYFKYISIAGRRLSYL